MPMKVVGVTDNGRKIGLTEWRIVTAFKGVTKHISMAKILKLAEMHPNPSHSFKQTLEDLVYHGVLKTRYTDGYTYYKIDRTKPIVKFINSIDYVPPVKVSVPKIIEEIKTAEPSIPKPKMFWLPMPHLGTHRVYGD